MMHIVSSDEWEKIEHALMKAEIPYKVSFDGHIVDENSVVYDRIINIDAFKIQILETISNN